MVCDTHGEFMLCDTHGPYFVITSETKVKSSSLSLDGKSNHLNEQRVLLEARVKKK